MVAVIDYDAGNIRSVEKAVNFLGEKTEVTQDRDRILHADRVILPGVGAFGDAMQKLRERKLDDVVREVVDKGTPFLGICLGMQVLFNSSEEAPGCQGLGILPGKIVRFQEREGFKVPHMGWNSLQFPKPGRLFAEMPDPYVYFVHSYYLIAEDDSIVTAISEYGNIIHASVEKGNLFACQFHPEKSSRSGLHILRNFLSFE